MTGPPFLVARGATQRYCCLMIPKLIAQRGCSAQVLPVGLHFVSLREFRDFFAFNPHRAWLFEQFKEACHALRVAGCSRIFVGGSYVTSEPHPSDYDACWDPSGVSAAFLDPIFYEEGRDAERHDRYHGDLLISGCEPGPTGVWFRYLSKDKITQEERGMIGIKLKLIEILNI